MLQRARQPAVISRDEVLSVGKKRLLRFLTCGSLDDGKSTLIGRLLYDCRLLLEDQLVALATDSKRFGTTGGDLDMALLVDGLQAETVSWPATIPLPLIHTRSIANPAAIAAPIRKRINRGLTRHNLRAELRVLTGGSTAW
jgi:hypothetical protein